MSDKSMESAVKELMELRRMREDLEQEIETIEDGIKARMGSEELLIAGCYKVQWQTIKSSRLDTKSLKAALPPETVSRFTVETVTRRFSVTA